nr:MAG TPA: optinuerin [Caudoviricetes sp.]
MAAEKNIRIGLKGYMPSAVAEAETAAMDNAVDVWRLNTASRLQGPVWQWSWPVSRMGDGGLQRSRAMICRVQQKKVFMIRRICNYFRGCWCKHEFELLAQVTEHDVLMGTSHHNTYRCKKCGYVQRVRL